MPSHGPPWDQHGEYSPDIGIQRSQVGDTPGALDPYLLGGGMSEKLGQFLLSAGTEARFGMTPEEKFARTVSPKGEIPGFEGRAPSPRDTDIAQRSLSVASGADRFGPVLPALLSLLAVDNPSIKNKEAAGATRKAIDAVREGRFTPGPMVGGKPMGDTSADKVLKLLTRPISGKASNEVADLLIKLLGAR
jgi:hypothetical protein